MKLTFLLFVLSSLVLVFTEIECRSRSDHHDRHEFTYPSLPFKTDRSRWSPFKHDDNSTNDESVANDDSSSTESSMKENEDESSKNEDHSKWSRHRESSPPPPPPPSGPVVHIDWGTIEGTVETVAGSNVSVFYGIPYAEPPVGRLRFRLPVKLEGHHRGIYNATKPKPACMQVLSGKANEEPISEDCLFMNIWVPRDDEDEQRSRWSRQSPSSHHEDGFSNSRWWSSPRHSDYRSSHRSDHQSERRSYHHSDYRSDRRSSFSPRQRSSEPRKRNYPVLFYIYGSQFKKYSSTYHMNRGGAVAAKGKIIFVSFNYRLQSFGFAYGADRDMPGNQALYDTLAALEWTRKNIAAFGGDPDKITISGSSAGSALAAMMALSPSVSPFLFDQVLLMSAVPMKFTTIEPTSRALNKTKALAAKLGCGEFPNDNFRITYEQLECLQAANATDIVNADTTDDMTLMGSCPDFAFMPIYGDDFMPSSPEVYLLKKQARRNMRFMVGSDHFDDVESGNYQPASRAEAEEHLNNMFYNMIKPDENITDELNYIYDYYFEGTTDNDTWALKERFSQLIGDNVFQCPLLLFIEKWATIDPVHYYYFNYTFDSLANSTEVKYQHGPMHGSANFMFLGHPFIGPDFSDRDRVISEKMIRILADFVARGEIPWPPMLASRRNKVLPLEWIIDEQVDTRNIKVSPKLDICRFMARMYRVYF
ncbi:cholinesterase-like [Panonychus citri]|uniref:cholinesterase-like n=1 Tax=Panonychus citri TaxID=50023 RepID=UPI0023081A03|nr:cholinesterase-like [Panonychus citri]